MKFKCFAAILAFIVSLSFQPLSVRAEDFNNELQQAINANNWKQAIEIIDKMIKVYSSAPDYVRELKAYRAKIKALQSSNNSHGITNTVNNNDGLIEACQRELNSVTLYPAPEPRISYYEGRISSGITTDNLDTIFALIEKAAVEYQLRNYEGALSLYAQVLQISPYDPSALQAIGSIMVKTKNYQEALKIFDQATKSYSFPTNDTKYRGLAYCILGNYQQARIDLEAYFQDRGGYDYGLGEIIKVLRRRT
jgi:tetratricopeptide (TPR) repeat protein